MASRRKKNFVARLVTGKKLPCAFCYREVDDELLYGKLYAIGDIQCHYYCVLLASCLIQKGKDDQGLFGFLYEDILAEVERCKKHKCSYCSQVGASLGCSISQCRKQFHLACGRERNSVSLFYGNYKTYCQNHAPKQHIPDAIMAKAKIRKCKDNKNKKLKHCNFKDLKELAFNDNSDIDADTQSVCVICYESVEGYPTVNTFWPPCCARDAWFHRTCLQRMALSAGMHYLKCPLCNDKENFYEAVLSQGYYVPDRDAAWELEQNAFAEIYERPVSCSAVECICPMGRSHDAETGSWSISICLLCGSSGQHSGCISDQSKVHLYICVVCIPAAPEDLENLANTIESVISEEERSNRTATRRPVMPSRMSIRRTKSIRRDIPSCSRVQNEANALKTESVDNTISSREILNLKAPKKQIRDNDISKKNKTVLSSPIKPKYTSPTKILEEELKNKFGSDEVIIKEKLIDELRKRFKKPQPFSVKKQIVNDILNGFFDNLLLEPKQKQPLKLWCSPKKLTEDDDVIEVPQKPAVTIDLSTTEDENIENNPKIPNNATIAPTNSTIPDNSTVPDNSAIPDNSTIPENSTIPIINIEQDAIMYPIIDTPKKLKPVQFETDSSLEISAKDEIVNIDVYKLDNKQNEQLMTPLNLPVFNNKCSFKFSPSDKEVLESKNINIDLENFKNQYLYEVSAISKENHNRLSKKRKLDTEKIVLKYETEKPDSKRSISIKNKNIKVKIKWRQKQLNLHIDDVQEKKNKSPYTQYVLKYSPKKISPDHAQTCSLIKPEVDLTPKKRKYIKTARKSPDNLVQTSIQNFFKIKTPE